MKKITFPLDHEPRTIKGFEPNLASLAILGLLPELVDKALFDFMLSHTLVECSSSLWTSAVSWKAP
jgi:hypothetical protein